MGEILLNIYEELTHLAKRTNKTMNEIRQMSPLQQSQVMCDLANHADTPICRTYGTWSANIKLGFWYQLGQWMEDGSVAPIPKGYELSANATAVLDGINRFFHDYGGQSVIDGVST